VTTSGVALGLLLARIGAFVAVMPLFSGRAPRSVRAGMVIVLAAFYLGPASAGLGALPPGSVREVDPIRYGLVLARESLIGAAMGLAFGLFLLPARIAGEFVTGQIGLNISPQVGPTGQDSAGPLTNVFETVAALVFLLVDGHHVVLAAFHASFASLPIGGTAVPQAGPLVTGLARAYEMGLLLAAPLALCLFLLAITLAVMARAAPQLNIYSVGFTLQVLVALIAGLFLIPEFVNTLIAIVGHTGEALPKMLGGP
jgi:flagellar biosynthetic protein FliR